MDQIYIKTIERLMVDKGKGCVRLCDVVDALKADGRVVTLAELPELARWAFEAPACCRVTLRSYGIVDSMWVAQVQVGEVRSPSGRVYHTTTQP